jgi:hypothetical protein
MITSHMSTISAMSRELSGNRGARRGYRADPGKWCHTASALDILIFPQSPGRWMAAGQKASGAPFPAWSLVIQAPGRVVADDGMAQAQVGGELAMRDRRSFRHSAAREAAGQ